jgi:hypothetical protein
MSASCVGTCSACGVRRFWLSDTLSLQLDDGTLKCLRHPGESYDCEAEGLTLAQAADRGRLYRETFFVCRSCGRTGEIIERRAARAHEHPLRPFSVRAMTTAGLMIGGVLGAAAVWFRVWDLAMWAAIVLTVLPLVAWNENRKWNAELSRRGLPRADAPGRVPVAPPKRGCLRNSDELVIGRRVGDVHIPPAATGACCDRPNWKWAGCEREEDRIPCYACGRGVMTISDHAIH